MLELSPAMAKKLMDSTRPLLAAKLHLDEALKVQDAFGELGAATERELTTE